VPATLWVANEPISRLRAIDDNDGASMSLTKLFQIAAFLMALAFFAIALL
jgi:hypothetical protein